MAMTVNEIVKDLRNCILANREDAVRDLGEQLHKAGGIALMRNVHACYVTDYGKSDGYKLEDWWDGVGNWRV